MAKTAKKVIEDIKTEAPKAAAKPEKKYSDIIGMPAYQELLTELNSIIVASSLDDKRRDAVISLVSKALRRFESSLF